ncbi:MAG: hypothetical protein JW894_12135 [Bacteroidales bacterium]|nr:hypothetical protein [Bacteroidales bacterium]
MSKPSYNTKPEKVTMTTNPRVISFLEKLIETGMFGRTKSEVAEQLIRRSMEDFLMSDKIEKLTKEL